MNIIQRIIEFILQLLGNKTEETPSVPAPTTTQPDKPSPQPEKPILTEQGIPFDNLKQSTVIKTVSDLPLVNAPVQNVSAPEWFKLNPKDPRPIPFDPIKQS